MSSIHIENGKDNKALLKSDFLPIIREHLSCYDPASKFLKERNPHYPERRYSITKGGKFECGLLFTIIEALKELNIYSPTDIDISRDVFAKINPKLPLNDDQLAELTIEPYDYQRESVLRMSQNGRGTVLIATGGGKTLIMSLFLKSIFENFGVKKTLVIVPSIQLVEQTYSDMIQYGLSPDMVSKWSGNNDFKNSNIIIAGVDILLSENSDLSFLSDIEILVIDEVHILKKSNMINSIVDKIPTMNRFGFTGTLPEEPIDQWNIFGRIGRVIYQKTSNELMGQSVISKAKIHIVKLQYSTQTHLELFDLTEKDRKAGYKTEFEFCINNEFRNNVIASICKVAKNNTLIMVDRIQHGELLYDKLQKETDRKVFFIHGGVDVDQREALKKIMEENHDVLCLAISKVFSTGISIKNIHNIIFCTPGKAKVKIIQSIGRGLRLHSSKQLLKVFDIADVFHYSSKHLEKRMQLYDQENLKYEIRDLEEKRA